MLLYSGYLPWSVIFNNNIWKVKELKWIKDHKWIHIAAPLLVQEIFFVICIIYACEAQVKSNFSMVLKKEAYFRGIHVLSKCHEPVSCSISHAMVLQLHCLNLL